MANPLQQRPEDLNAVLDKEMGPFAPHFPLWAAGRFSIDLSVPKIMGIVNLTPDSFSDGGLHLTPSMAISHAEKLLNDGADILDIGAESSRPGATPISGEEEWGRLKEVLQELVSWNCPISLDTYRPETMRKGLELGVDIINDIWALRQTGAIDVVSGSDCGLCLMHMQGNPQTMQLAPIEKGCVQLVKQFFLDLTLQLKNFDIGSNRWVLDPGIGFGKSVSQNLALLAHQQELMELGQPMLVGWSRKSTLGQITGLAPNQRLIPSVAASLLAVERGARVVRVHDVEQTRQAMQIWTAIKNEE
jgi:dihydropteroate synthase